MPRITERQEDTNVLLNIFIVHLLARMEADAFRAGADSESDSEASSDSSQASDDPITEGIINSIEELYKDRYTGPRRDIPKTQENLRLLLDDYHKHFPDIFRSYTRITPECFDDLVNSIKDHPVFHNNSNNPQMAVKEQVAIALYRFGHYGNAASTMKVALWAGVSYGTVRNITIRVMTALCDPRFRAAIMPWPNPEEIERAKAWVEGNSCPAWRDGWWMVDGTLVPLFQRPHHFGNTFFDRKSNYSMNVQVINRPDLKIIDYGIGYPGSQHDATAWRETRLPPEHEQLFGPGDFVWADSAYPLKTWCQAPYKETLHGILKGKMVIITWATIVD
ncbi:hypothetical protein BYT27DRAFT_7220661 [Phlegmacium glaucopus]|nr:hypothetical protein BYT27DRAFT_7220661 [Phlegmacium glaucopus]